MRIQRRRRRENKTDYLRRKKLLSGEMPRIVFRKTNKYIISQYVESHEAQDKILITTNSKDLLKNGWPKNKEGSLKSIPAAYLTGYLMGKRIVKLGNDNKNIIDFGMIQMEHRNRTFAFIKGLVDSGLDISCDEEYFPDEEKIMGKGLKEDFSKEFNKVKSNLEKL